MAHIRNRHLAAQFDKLLKTSALVGVFGHRQTGKTTFVSAHSGNYITFDRQQDLSECNKDSELFLKNQKSSCTVIDECQLSPSLFPALKEWVRTHKRPGQFILTGSVRFTSRKAIRESLTGRIISAEMLPMTVAELQQRSLPDAAVRLLSSKDFTGFPLADFHARFSSGSSSALEKYIRLGGLPGICLLKDAKNRKDHFSALIRLILDRDLRQIVQTTLSLDTLERYLRFIASRGLDLYSFAEARRSTGLSEQTQKKLLFAFESIFLIRRIPAEGVSGESILLEDQLEERELSDNSLAAQTQLTTAIYRNLRAQFTYRSGEQLSYFQYRTRGGAYVPLALRNERGILGFIVISTNSPSVSEKRSADSFMRANPGAKVVFLSSSLKTPVLLNAVSCILPVASVI